MDQVSQVGHSVLQTGKSTVDPVNIGALLLERIRARRRTGRAVCGCGRIAAIGMRVQISGMARRRRMLLRLLLLLRWGRWRKLALSTICGGLALHVVCARAVVVMRLRLLRLAILVDNGHDAIPKGFWRERHLGPAFPNVMYLLPCCIGLERGRVSCNETHVLARGARNPPECCELLHCLLLP